MPEEPKKPAVPQTAAQNGPSGAAVAVEGDGFNTVSDIEADTINQAVHLHDSFGNVVDRVSHTYDNELSKEQSAEQGVAPGARTPELTLWARIKGHKIAQWTLAYAAAAYALLDATKILSEAFDWPHQLLR